MTLDETHEIDPDEDPAPAKALTPLKVFGIAAAALLAVTLGCCAVGAFNLLGGSTTTSSPTTAPVLPEPVVVATTRSTPTASPTPVVRPTPTKSPTRRPPTKSPSPSPSPSSPKTVKFPVVKGTACHSHWWFGYTASKKLMQCKPGANDSTFKWRAA